MLYSVKPGHLLFFCQFLLCVFIPAGRPGAAFCTGRGLPGDRLVLLVGGRGTIGLRQQRRGAESDMIFTLTRMGTGSGIFGMIRVR